MERTSQSFAQTGIGYVHLMTTIRAVQLLPCLSRAGRVQAQPIDFGVLVVGGPVAFVCCFLCFPFRFLSLLMNWQEVTCGAALRRGLQSVFAWLRANSSATASLFGMFGK